MEALPRSEVLRRGVIINFHSMRRSLCKAFWSRAPKRVGEKPVVFIIEV